MSHTSDSASLSRFIFDFLLEAGEIARNEQQKAQMERKTDRSIVTNADLAISALFQERFKTIQDGRHFVVDEEVIDRDNIDTEKLFSLDHAYTWLIDPIAGTACYASGLQLYAISVGVLKDQKPFVGGVYFPALQELYLSDSQDSWFYTAPKTLAGSRIKMLPPKFSDEFTPPLFHHCSTRVLNRYNIVQKDMSFVMIPSVNIGILWAALGGFSAAIIQVKLWDFAGAWAILNTMGMKIRNIETGAVLEKINSDIIDAEWYMHEAYMITLDNNFDSIVKKICKI